MDISIIIVNYNTAFKTLACLQSIFTSDLEGINFEVIVVDNNSKDNMGPMLKEKYPQVKFIESLKNVGMGEGNNIGIRNSQGDFILILNPDTLLFKSAILNMYNYLQLYKDVGIVGPKLLNSDKTLQYSCARFPKCYTPIIRRTFLSNYFKKHIAWFLMHDFSHEEIKEVDWLMGSCLLIRRSSWSFFDKRFFMYFEDIDLCRRAWHNSFKVVYLPQARVIHDHQRASAKLVWYLALFKNKIAREHIKSWLKYFYKWKIERFKK
ncbi:MAG: glycosyltransferase family 2 protein [Candidatus Pacebacteria bacterium]|nr:glycosyltransferase family 2 protein [Candidatus Paceibacterota bacterium]